MTDYRNDYENIHAGEGRATYQLVNLSRVREEAEVPGKEGGWITEPIRAKSGAIAQLAEPTGMW